MNDVGSLIEQLEQQRESIEKAIAALREITPGRSAPAKSVRGAGGTGTGAGHRKRRLSPEGRRRIAEAARKRWADLKAGQAGGSKTARKTRRKAAKRGSKKAAQSS